MDIDYFGKDMEPRACELRGMKIDPMHRQNEADLVQSRWFDYSALTPTRATYLYAHYYKVQTVKFCTAYIDARTSENARAFTPDDVFMGRDATAMWLARRAADALGVPYPYVLQFAQERALSRLYQCFPRPNQLYGEEFEMDLASAWHCHLTHSLYYSRQPFFKASRYVKAPMQTRHAMFVIEQIKRRALPHTNLLARMIGEDVLSPALLAEHFSEAVIAQAEVKAVQLRSQS